jgi:hypothetical protein
MYVVPDASKKTDYAMRVDFITEAGLQVVSSFLLNYPGGG